MSIKVGDVVRLKRSFMPKSVDWQVYRFAVVVGLVTLSDAYQAIVQLYDPKNDTVYTDEFGSEAMYSFELSELEELET